MKRVFVSLSAAALLAAAAPQSFTGTVTDSMCGRNHAMMKISPEDKCIRECVKGGYKYALLTATKVYRLSDQKTPEKFAGQRVRVTGVLYEKTGIIKVESISASGK
jgi:hypothetical protein